MSIFDFFKKKEKQPQETSQEVNEGLKKTRDSFLDKLGKALIGKSEVNDDFLDDLEEVLITSDVGVKTTLEIIDRLKKRVSKDKYLNSSELKEILKDEMAKLMMENIGKAKSEEEINNIIQEGSPLVIMVVGVNGVGKTTTIGKLANQFKQNGMKVLLVAGDTFRAGAVDQLEIWSNRAGVDFFSKGMNTDPSAVIFEALQKAENEKYQIVLVDTAGRLHNKVNLMNELGKVKRVMSKIIPTAPHEVLLVLDASTGQNAFEQATKFTEATEVSALALTKLDGTAKGGVVIGVSSTFNIPVKYIGVGEKMTDLKNFEPQEFINSLFYESSIR